MRIKASLPIACAVLLACSGNLLAEIKASKFFPLKEYEHIDIEKYLEAEEKLFLPIELLVKLIPPKNGIAHRVRVVVWEDPDKPNKGVAAIYTYRLQKHARGYDFIRERSNSDKIDVTKEHSVFYCLYRQGPAKP
jgi:hypothetical protein